MHKVYMDNNLSLSQERIVSAWLFIGLVLFQISFMGIPGSGLEGERASSLAIPKFLMQTFGFLCFLKAWSYRKYLTYDKLIVWVVMYLFFCFLSISNRSLGGRDWDWIGFFRLVSLIYLLPLCFILIRQKGENSLFVLYLSLLAPVLIILVVYAIDPDYAYRVVYDGGSVTEKRLGGDIIPPNTLGGIIGLALVIRVCLWLGEWKKTNLVIFFILLTMLYMTTSRAAIFATAISILVSLVVFNRISKGIAMIGMLFAAVSLYAFDFYYFLSERQAVGLSDFGGRSELWFQAADYFLSMGFFGWLFGGGYMLPEALFYTGSLQTNSLHSGYLQVLCGVGFFGFFCYSMIWACVIIRSFGSALGAHVLSITSFGLLFNISELGGLVLPNSFSLVLMFAVGILVAEKSTRGL